ncbi:hypothetical protein SAMN06296386_11215 [Lachnospiraceae bacterium]|nr:hypothetical protein SAMN06296386_11215 [Lachnospiraceae bacterium]
MVVPAVRVAIKLGSVVAGVCTLIFGILAVFVLINKMWLQLGILALIYGAMMVVLFDAAEVQVWIDVATDLLRDV